MKSLKERQNQRAHHAAVYGGKVKDPIVTYGTETPNAMPEDTGEGNGGGGTADYSKLGTHAELDAALGQRSKPENWDNLKVTEKQAWLTANSVSSGW
jgi:hypothetical protein